VEDLFGYYPKFILDKAHFRFPSYQSNFGRVYLPESAYVGSIFSHVKEKPQFVKDDYFKRLLIESGMDYDRIRLMYNLTPIRAESVYKDFSKYFNVVPKLLIDDFSFLEESALWLYRFKARCFTNNPRILNYDLVVEGLDKNKSATALFNKHFPNKRELLDDNEFKDSYVRFVKNFLTDHNYKTLWLAIQKEEIRPFEKIQDLKFRSIIVGSIYSLILGQTFTDDIDSILTERWDTYRCGIGMSFFHLDYDKMTRNFEGFPIHFVMDLSKFDSGQMSFMTSLEHKCNALLLRRETCTFYEILGSLSVNAHEMGFSDFSFSVPLIMERLAYVSQDPTILPYGDFYSTNGGEKSGSWRTGHANSARNKMVEFASAIKLGYTFEDYMASDYYIHHTGDDNKGRGLSDLLFKEIELFWKRIGLDSEVRYPKTLYESDYLSTLPVLVETYKQKAYMPVFNTAKIFSGLVFKMRDRTIESDISRLVATEILSYFSGSDLELIRNMIQLYKTDHPDLINHPSWLLNHEIMQLYFGEYETTSFRSDLLFWSEHFKIL